MARRKTKRRRRRSPKKKRTYRRRTKARGGKRKSRGLSGKIGALILGVVPPVISGIEAADVAMNQKKARELTALGTLQVGFYRWLNNLSYGFLGTVPFQKVSVSKVDGSRFTYSNLDSGLPKGSLWSVAGVGMLMMAYDWIAAKLAGGEVKIPMTNYAATGSR